MILRKNLSANYKILLGCLFLTLLILGSGCLVWLFLHNQGTPANQISDGAKINLRILVSGGAEYTFNVEVASTEQSRQTGLMNRTELAETSGMLFIFPESYPLSFWMKNTYIPLDIIFLDDQKKIITIHKQTIPLQEIPTYDSGNKAKYAIELTGGASNHYNIKVGDKVVF